MKRRDFLASAGVAAVGLSAFPLRWVPAAQGKNRRYCTSRSHKASFVGP